MSTASSTGLGRQSVLNSYLNNLRWGEWWVVDRSASTAWGSAPTRTGRAWSSRPKASGEKQGRPRRRVGTSDIWGALVRFQRLSVPFFWGKVNKRLAKDRFLRVPSWNAETGLCRRLLGQLRVNWMMAQWAGSSPRACEERHHGGYRGLLWLLCPV